MHTANDMNPPKIQKPSPQTQRSSSVVASDGRRRGRNTTLLSPTYILLLLASWSIAFHSKLSLVAAAVLQPIVRINAGGPAFTDPNGVSWQGDAYYKTGGSSGEYRISSASIQNTTNPQLYQSEHFWRRSKTGPFLYQIPVPKNGPYTVELHFAELTSSRAKVGKRTFDILVQNVLVFPKFDIFERAGAAFTALKVASVTKATNKTLSIEFRGIRFNPTIAGIAIFWNGKAPIPPTKGLSPSLAPAVATVPQSSPTATKFQPILINAGGAPFVDAAGNTWKGDFESNFFSGGFVTSVQTSIAGTSNDGLYTSERAGAFTYEIPLPEADYECKLHFVELYPSQPGSRVFDVLVEQQPTFVGVDIYSLVGPATALVLDTAVAVVDGALSISFSGTVGSAQLAAIEVHLIGDHLAHAVASGPYAAVDVLGKGFAMVPVDATESHSHGTGRSLVQWLWYSSTGTIVGTGEITTLNLTVGEHDITLVVTNDVGDKSSETTMVTVFPQGFPVIVSLTPTSGYVEGGNPIVIDGYGFNFAADQVVVRVGKATLTGTSQIAVVSDTKIEVLAVPPSLSGIPVAVTVTTPKGVSNTAVYKYTKGSPIDWTRGNLYNIFSPTTLAFGPDSKLYVGNSDGKIVKLTLSGSNKVVAAVVSTVIGKGRAILGMAFDPLSANLPNPPVYVSHSQIFHGEWKSSSGGAINGKVSMVSGANLDQVTDIVVGLPVSDHDHAVNGLEFGDAGELYILVGSNTNGGIPGALSGTRLQKENALSAAVLVAYLSRPDYNGRLQYDSEDNGNLMPGSGVEVFASGLRNSYHLHLHSNGKLYATDNGSNIPYGDMSKSCTEAIPDVETEDELNLIVRGAYYGHPNRLRGQTDPRQCVWHSGTEASTSEYTAPMAILPASSDGIIEFQSDHFGKQMRGDLLIAKYKGGLYRVILTPDGTAVAEAPFLFDDGADLSIAQGPDGSLYSIKPKAGKVQYLIPLEPTSITLVVKSVFPRRGGQAGGTTLRIFGERFDSSESPTVTIGGRPCLVLAFTAVEISCTLPGGTGTVDIVVTTGAESATFLAGYRYITGMPGLVALFRINAGGEAYRDSTGNVWEADAKNAYYARGAASRSDSAASTGTKGATTATISGTTDGALYQSYRVFPFGTSSPFLYVLPVPAADKYKVVLHFCEVDLFRTMPGSRVMDIYIEGKLFRQGFDIAAAAGGVFIAMTLSATEYVSDGAISIELKAVKHNPIIAAIEVFSVDKYP